MNRIDLQDRVAVITGGARGIGYAIAERMLGCGARVALWDRDSDRLTQSKEALQGLGTVSTHTLDVTDAAQVERTAAETRKAHGKIDILVASAGITGPNVKTWEYAPQDFRQVLEINLVGLYLCNRAVVPIMIQNDYGRILNIASIAGKEGNPNAPAYSASKAGVIALTKSLGKELAHTNIRVNCITPAAAQTEMFAQMTQQHIDFMLSKIPMARFVKVEEIAAMVAWICSEECSFTTGAVFDISGGRATY
jgi:3-oxoacyl-[acyl-carrier protein] reductase